MPRQHRGRKHAQPQWTHEEAQDALLAYMYGRLTRAEDAALEAHIESCDWCRADGLRHLNAERHHMQQQRPKKPRRASRRAGMAVLCGVFGALVGLAGFAGVMVMHPNILLRAHAGQIPSPTRAPDPTATPSPTAVPALAATTSIPATEVVALAWSPDGTALAASTDATATAAANVTRYSAKSATWTGARCTGGESAVAPGALAWSPDGARLAGAGKTRITLWGGTTCQGIGYIALPPNAGTDLYAFDTVTGAVTGSAPATLFATTGYAAWGTGGKLQSATATTKNSFALWDGPQGMQIFRDAQNLLWMGTTADDQATYAAWLRWSPDGRYLLWGYPRLPLSGAAKGVATFKAALTAAIPATKPLLASVSSASDAQASITLWLSADHTQMLIADATHSPTVWTCRATQNGAILAKLPTPTTPVAARTGAAWRQDGSGFARAAAGVEIFPAP